MNLKFPKMKKLNGIFIRSTEIRKQYFSKNEEWATSLKEIQKDTIKLDGKILQPKLENHLTGWNISIESPFTGNHYIIKEDGKILTSKI